MGACLKAHPRMSAPQAGAHIVATPGGVRQGSLLPLQVRPFRLLAHLIVSQVGVGLLMSRGET